MLLWLLDLLSTFIYLAKCGVLHCFLCKLLLLIFRTQRGFWPLLFIRFCNYNTFLLISNHYIILFAKTCPSRKTPCFWAIREIFFNNRTQNCYIWIQMLVITGKNCQVPFSQICKLIFKSLDTGAMKKVSITVHNFYIT